MARTWLSITVELLGGRGEDLWPWPGRILAVGPAHTFADLAEAINTAFARWDRAHLSVFTLADGRTITDAETAAELSGGGSVPFGAALDHETVKVARIIGPAQEFEFVFDLGDHWVHRCTVAEEKIDPLEELGIRPDHPLPFWGWGAIPDQYGRRWADDDGSQDPPPRPAQPHPMQLHQWPGDERLPPLDLRAMSSAIAREDAEAFLAAVVRCDITDTLQQVAAGVPMALEQRRAETEPLVLSLHNQLTMRADHGDAVLAEDLRARLRLEALPGRELTVDLELLSDLLEGDPGQSLGGYLDLRTGEVVPDEMLDPAVTGEDPEDLGIDLEGEPDRFLRVDRSGSREAWQDMAVFAARQRDSELRSRLERAIEGRGAFRRFRDLVAEEGLMTGWQLFSSDRRIGRARQFLASEGIRVP